MSPTPSQTEPLVGRTLAHYSILEKLGEGGMGVVYKARDTHLDRLVAIKVLPLPALDDEHRRSRFVREAKAASALNHPNIVTIHDISQADGVDFIAMEFVPGKTLGELVGRKHLPLADALRMGVQIADALATAHAAGIIHRDIKPGNIMVTDNGLVKVLDFGLAKLSEPVTSDSISTRTLLTAPADRTEEGKIVGTIAYMSPEQAQGKPTDARSDIFSFGSLLYEMATGVRAFQGDTKLSILSAILQKDPEPVSAVRHDVPPDLERIISRCLKKDVERRFQHMGDVRVALQELKEESESGVKAAPQLHRRVPFSRRTAILAAAVLVLAAVTGVWWWRVAPSRLPFRRVEMQALTTSGDVMEAAISPDGRYLARIAARGDGQTVYLRHLRTGSEVQVLSVPRVAVGGLQFSRDGDYLYYTQEKEPSRATLYRVPSLGGSPEIVLDGVDRHVAVSPDGRRFAWSTGGTDKTSSVIVAGPGRGTKENLITWKEPDFIDWDLAWSPDAKLVAVPIGSVDDRYWSIERLLVLPLDRSSPKILWPVKWDWVRCATWLPDGKALLVNAKAQGHQLLVWVVPYPTGEPWETTNDLNKYEGVSVTSDSSAFVSVQQNERGEMWMTAPRAGSASQLTQTSSNGEGRDGIVWTPDGKLVYTQIGSGTDADIWIANADNTNPKRLTFGGVAIYPAIAPDGRTIYFGAERDGMCHIWRMDADGGNASQVTHGGGERLPGPSPDGKWLVYEAFSLTGPPSVWKMALPAGSPEKLGNLKSMGAPSISPDGQWLAVSYSDERIHPASGTALMRLDGTDFRPLTDVSAWVKWSPDGRSIYLAKSDQGVDNIWKQAITGGRPVRITNFFSGYVMAMAVSHDERLAFHHLIRTSDAVLIRSLR